MQRVAGKKLRIAVGGLRRELFSEAREAYDEAKAAMQFHFYQWERPIYAGRLEYESRQPPYDPFPDREKICDFLSAGQVGEGKAIFDSALEATLQSKPPLHPDLVRQAVSYCLLGILGRFDGIFSEELRGALVYEINSLQAFCPTVTELTGRSHRLLERMARGIADQRQAVGADRMETIRRYLDEHFKEDLTLNGVADRFFFNRSYFSTIFKNYVGKSFSQYLADIRIERAKRMLGDPGYKVCDVAQAVGYHDASYFARTFKRKTGFSPEEYRRMGGNCL